MRGEGNAFVAYLLIPNGEDSCTYINIDFNKLTAKSDYQNGLSIVFQGSVRYDGEDNDSLACQISDPVPQKLSTINSLPLPSSSLIYVALVIASSSHQAHSDSDKGDM